MATSDMSAETSIPPLALDRPQSAQASLQALKAVLALDHDGASPADLLHALRPIFAFEQALLLDDNGDDLECIAALPPEHVGRRSAATAFYRAIVAGRVSATESGQGDPPADLISPTQPALCFPIALRARCAALVLARAEGAPSFTVDDIAVARQCAVVALATLAVRNSAGHLAEIQRLSGLVEE